MTTLDRSQGCVLGLALGDAFGAPYEGGVLERFVWGMIGKTSDRKRRFTDDTQMMLDMMGVIVEHGELDLDAIATQFAQSYRWSRGYGPAAAKLLKKIKRGAHWNEVNRAVYKEGSLGNGGAMRAAPLALLFDDQSVLFDAAKQQARITHAHPLGQDGAGLIACATHMALKDMEPIAIVDELQMLDVQQEYHEALHHVREWLTASTLRTAQQIRISPGVGMTALESCMSALYMALSHFERDFESMMSLIWSCGGDADTISAMAGAIWGARHGHKKLPSSWLKELEGRAVLEALAADLLNVTM